MRMNYVPKHSREHGDSEYVSYVEVDQGSRIYRLQTYNQLY